MADNGRLLTVGKSTTPGQSNGRLPTADGRTSVKNLEFSLDDFTL